jgi:hypothetical protein
MLTTINWIRRIEQRRRMIGLPLVQLAKQIGLSYPQTRRYEFGPEPYSGRPALWHLAGARRHVGWFFEGITDATSVPEDAPESR